jgi:elongation factor Ts
MERTPEYIAREDVPAKVVEDEKAFITTQIRNDPANAPKPEKVIEKIIEGKVGKVYEQLCLLEQPYVKDDSMTVAAYIDSFAKETGGTVKVSSFHCFQKGEGLQKREDNFAEEIAQLTK